MTTWSQDRLKGGIEKIIRAVVGPRIDYLCPYSAVVVQQNSDKSLDIQPDDTRLPGLQGIPIDYGVPGISADVNAGSRCLLQFVGGDPSKPRVTLWELNSISQITVTAPNIKWGSSSAAEQFVLGTAYAGHMANLTLALTNLIAALTALSSALTPMLLPPAVAAAQAAIALAITAVNSASTATGPSGLQGDVSTTVYGQ